MASPDMKNTVNECSTLVKAETYELYNVKGLRICGKLEVYEKCSTYSVNIFRGEELAIYPPALGGMCFRSDHEKSCRKEVKNCLRDKQFITFCKKLAAEYEIA